MSDFATDRTDIEMAFIRTFAARGLVLTGISASEAAERIRVAIFEAGYEDEAFNSTMTYAQAYQRCYRRKLEMRTVDRGGNRREDDADGEGEA